MTPPGEQETPPAPYLRNLAAMNRDTDMIIEKPGCPYITDRLRIFGITPVRGKWG